VQRHLPGLMKMKKQAKPYYDVKQSTKRICVLQGGTRSGKTYSVLLALIEFAYKNKGKGLYITIARKTMPALRGTSMRDFFEILKKENLYDERLHNKSNHLYTLYGNNFEFISVDQPQRVRGRKREILFLNECNEFSLDEFIQLSLRTTFKIIIDFNPSEQYHWLYTNLIDADRDDVDFHISTYRDNPFLEESTISEIERLKEIDENLYRVFSEGQRGVATETIFPTFNIVDDIPDNAKEIALGLDFGYSADPTSLVKVYKHDLDLYVDELLYEKGLTNQDIAHKIKELGIDRSIEIYADSAEPKSIEEIYRMGGINIKPAKKGSDSIRIGIDVIKRHKLNITKRSLNAIKEFRNYKWIKDKNNQITNKPIDAYNHAIDAVRYVALNKLMVSYSGKYYIA
jgi:phage terminase large subunit